MSEESGKLEERSRSTPRMTTNKKRTMTTYQAWVSPALPRKMQALVVEVSTTDSIARVGSNHLAWGWVFLDWPAVAARRTLFLDLGVAALALLLLPEGARRLCLVRIPCFRALGGKVIKMDLMDLMGLMGLMAGVGGAISGAAAVDMEEVEVEGADEDSVGASDTISLSVLLRVDKKVSALHTKSRPL